MGYGPHRRPDTDFSDVGVRTLYVNANGGAEFATITQATAYITAAQIGAPRRIVVGPGAYVENVALPAQTYLTGIGEVNITGTITLAASAAGPYFLENLRVTSAAAGTCLNADMNDTVGDVQIRNCTFTTSAVGIGILAQAANLTLDDVTINCNASTGISLLGPSATVANTTRLRAGSLRIVGTDAVAGIVTADGAAGGRVSVEATDLTLELTATAAVSVGIVLGSTGAVAAATPRNGAWIDNLHCFAAGAGAFATTFVRLNAAATESRIGRIDGCVRAVAAGDVLIDGVAGDLVVGSIDFPDDGVVRGAFQAVVMTAGTIRVLGGEIAGGTGALFQNRAGAGNLTVKDVRVQSVGVLGSIYGGTDCTGAVRFEDCMLRGTSAVAKMAFDGLDGTGPAPVLLRTRLEADGLAPAVTVLDADFTLIDTEIAQATGGAGNDTLRVNSPSAAANCAIVWEGHNVLASAGGGAFGLFVAVPAGGVITVVERGLLGFGGTAVASQFSFGAGVTLTASTVATVAQGFIPTFAAVDIIGDAVNNFGVPSSYPGLHFVTTVAWTLTGAAANDSTNTVTVENETTALAAASAAWGVDTGIGVVALQNVALVATIPVGPGQMVRIACTVIGAASTNVTVAAV